MNPLEQEIIQRFEESRNAYNRASSLLKSGRSDQAEALLRQALTMYPREIFLNEDVEIDKSVLDSYDLLFSNIRERLEKIERDRELPPRLDSKAIKSLQDLIERNQGPALTTRRPGMKTQAEFTPASGMPMPPAPAVESAPPALDLDEPRLEFTHDQIVAELEAAARTSYDEPSAHTGASTLEEGAIDAFEISLHGEDQPPVPAEEPAEDFDFEIRGQEPGADTHSLDTAIADEIEIQEDFGLEQAAGEPAAAESEPVIEPLVDLDADFEMEPAPEQQPEPSAAPSGDQVSVDLDADLDAALSALETEVAEPADTSGEQAVDEEAAAPEPEPASAQTHSEFDDLTPIPSRDDAEPAKPDVRETRLPDPVAAQSAPQVEDVTAIPIPPLPEPPVNGAAGDMDIPNTDDDELLSDEDDAPDGRNPGRGLMGFFEKIKSKLRKKPKDEFDKMLDGEQAQPVEEAIPAVEEPAPAEAPAPEPVEEPVPQTPPPPPPPQAQAPGQAQPGEEEALEDDAVVAELVKIEEPKERKVHIQVYDGGRTARLLANVLVLGLFGLGLLIAFMLARPSVQLHHAYSAALDHDGEQAAAEEPSRGAHIVNLAWGIIEVTGESDQRAAAAVKSVSVASAPDRFQATLAAGSVSSLLQAGQIENAVRLCRWARGNGLADQTLNRLESQSLVQAAELSIKQGKPGDALKIVETLNSRLEDPSYPAPGLHAQAAQDAARMQFLAMAHSAGAALKAGDAQKAFKLIEPALNGGLQPAPALASSFDSLKAKIKAALLAEAEAARQAGKAEQAQAIDTMAAGL